MAESLETILVVDDTAAEMGAVVSVLQCANFNVLEADGATSAIKLAGTYAGGIDLLLSDLEMPVMSGPNLGDELKKTRSDLHMMFISRVSGGDMLVFNHGWALIEKLLVPTKLLEMINNALHCPPNSLASNPYDTREVRDSKGVTMQYRSYSTRR